VEVWLVRRSLLLVVAVGAGLAIFWWARHQAQAEIPFRGQMIKLSKSYYDFDSYKNDPDNIAPSETARVQELVVDAPIAHSFPNRLDLFRATGEIQFPGYGSGSGGGPQPDGSELLAIVIEIPRADKDRYIVFRGKNENYKLVDDFVQSEILPPFGIRVENGAYIYLNAKGEEAFRRTLH
jgi:hypothetical protein